MIASSSSSPPMRIDWLTTMPPSEITATSLVPPPMSTTIEPVGSPTGSPAPTAPARRRPRRDAGRHGLLDEVGRGGAGREAGLLHRALLHAGDARGHADHDA